jgi:hypothetical protein
MSRQSAAVTQLGWVVALAGLFVLAIRVAALVKSGSAPVPGQREIRAPSEAARDPDRTRLPAAPSPRLPRQRDCSMVAEPLRDRAARLRAQAGKAGSPYLLYALGSVDPTASRKGSELLTPIVRNLGDPRIQDVQVECTELACRISVIHEKSVEPKKWQLAVQQDAKLRGLGARFAGSGVMRPLSPNFAEAEVVLTDLYLHLPGPQGDR